MTASASAQPRFGPELFEQLGIEDPRLIQLAQLMSANAAYAPEPEHETIEMVRADRLSALEGELAHVKGVNRILLEQCELMAAAVGACPQCWGEDRNCPTCRGDGSPGAFLPDRGSFAALVMPAVQRIRARRRPLAAAVRADPAATPQSAPMI